MSVFIIALIVAPLTIALALRKFLPHWLAAIFAVSVLAGCGGVERVSKNYPPLNSVDNPVFAAAQEGDAQSQFEIGRAYYDGHGGPQNYAEAVKWYRRAAEQGHAKAENNLGYAHHSGEGVPLDYAEALKWYRRAAEQGLEIAQSNLGAMYLNGEGVSKNRREAYIWFSLAAAQGEAYATGQRNDIANKMSAAELSSAQKEIDRRSGNLASDEKVADAEDKKYQPNAAPDPDALHKAAHKGDLATVRKLLDEGADIEFRAGSWGYAPDESKRRDMGVFFPSELFSLLGNEVVIVYGSQLFPNRSSFMGVRIPGEKGQGQKGTPLHWAARGNAREVVAFLIERGANLESLTKSLQTPLHWAAREDASDAIAELVEHGANLEARSKPWSIPNERWIFGNLHGRSKAPEGMYTPLHMAVKSDASKAVSILLANGANPGAQDNTGETPLHSAIFNENREIAIALIKHGANMHAANTRTPGPLGSTPLEIAMSKNNFELVDELQKISQQARDIPQKKNRSRICIGGNRSGRRV